MTTSISIAIFFLAAHPQGRAPQEVGELLVAGSVLDRRDARSLPGPIAVLLGATSTSAAEQLRPQEERLGEAGGLVPSALHAEDGGGGCGAIVSYVWGPHGVCEVEKNTISFVELFVFL